MVLPVIVFLSFLVEAAAGFGSMVIALTLGAMWFQVDALLTWLVPVNEVLSLWLVARGWRSIRWAFLAKRVGPLMGVGLVVGTLISAQAAQAWWLKPLFGVFVVAVAVWQLSSTLKPNVEAPPLPFAARVSALLGAGVIHGIFATGGPLAVFVTARELPEKAQFRATLSALWAALNGVLLANWAWEGRMTGESLTQSAWLLLPLAGGIAVGEWVHHRLDERRFRIAVASLLLAAGTVLTLRSLATLGNST